MQNYLYWIGGAIALVIFILVVALRRSQRSTRTEHFRRMELEEMVHHKIKEQGAREMLDLWEAYRFGDRRHQPYYRNAMREYHGTPWEIERRRLLPDQRAEAADAKRDSILKLGPKTFYYLDEMQVKDLYPQVFREPEPKQIETQEQTSSKKGAKANLKLIGGNLSNVREEQTKKSYELELTPVIMYNRVEEYLFQKGDVIFGVDDFQQDHVSIEGFEAMCQLMEEKFHFPVPDDLQKKFISDQMRSFALDVVKALASTSGYIALQSEFSISKLCEDGAELTLMHPLNKHLLVSDQKAQINICCQNVCLTPAGKATFGIGSSVKITCLGKVVRWDSERTTLVINPIAIY